ncbi:hypothetical protein ANN_01504 [Periplaneta americana]|uniref:Uncharacterized protein n=1 Tax=Periplaneta americana TaxID=6978 RepID=A0ABQ8TVH9_PERAM|nr:hypothetical protein ANN_01504 [Periplaneta americana]
MFLAHAKQPSPSIGNAALCGVTNELWTWFVMEMNKSKFASSEIVLIHKLITGGLGPLWFTADNRDTKSRDIKVTVRDNSTSIQRIHLASEQRKLGNAARAVHTRAATCIAAEDLTPLDFFLWGFLKDRVFADKPRTVPELMERTCTADCTRWDFKTNEDIAKDLKSELVLEYIGKLRINWRDNIEAMDRGKVSKKVLRDHFNMRLRDDMGP